MLEFWFGPNADAIEHLKQRNQLWFSADAAVDQKIREQFGATLEAAAAGELKRWKLTSQGTLALVVVFDQFSRNIHRGTPQAFVHDMRALALVRDAIAMGTDEELSLMERSIFYLPLEHAEDLEAQRMSVACYQRLLSDAPAAYKASLQKALDYAVEHYEIVERFGRFPHRNLALDRASTPDENEWLSTNAGKFGQG